MLVVRAVVDHVLGWPLTVWLAVGLAALISFAYGCWIGNKDGAELRDAAWSAWLRRIQQKPARGKSKVFEAAFPHCCFPPQCHHCTTSLPRDVGCTRRCSQCIVDAQAEEG